jgi:predicted nuclease of predicted toxin-antitoxin system
VAVRELGLREAEDPVILAVARARGPGTVVLTKYSDFLDRLAWCTFAPAAQPHIRETREEAVSAPGRSVDPSFGPKRDTDRSGHLG